MRAADWQWASSRGNRVSAVKSLFLTKKYNTSITCLPPPTFSKNWFISSGAESLLACFVAGDSSEKLHSFAVGV